VTIRNTQYAQNARDFVAFNRVGNLSTLSQSHKGFPFGSIVPYDVTEQGDIIIYVSKISEHYKNIISDSRASLFISDPFGIHDPQAHARATLLVNFIPVEKDSLSEVEKSYRARFPNSESFEISHDFVFMRGAPENIRWIGGFGDMGWVNGDAYRGASPDILAYTGLDIVRHMNFDHPEALTDYVRAFSSLDPSLYSLQMTHIHCGGFTITLSSESEEERLEIPFPKILKDIEEVRGAMIELLKSARAFHT